MTLTGLGALLGLFIACAPKVHDIENPHVTLVTPHDLDSITPGNVPVKAVATDDVKVTHVVFEVNGTPFADDSQAVADTFDAVWNAAAETLGGVYRIDAVAYDTRDSAAGAFARVIVQSSIVPKTEITFDPDDGTMAASRRIEPDSAVGFIYGRGTNAAVGVYRAGDTLASRALYRFDISNWTSGDIRLHLNCREITGVPGPIDVYAVNDFDSIPTPGQRARFDGLWYLKNTGTVADTITPALDWFAARIPAALVQQYRSAGGYLALMLVAHNEATMVDAYYHIDTYSSTIPGLHRPYLTW
jgi:hypothetical protein